MMKKIRTALLMAIIAVFGIAMFAACGSSKEGVYKFYSLTQEENGLKTEYHVGDEIEANTKLTEDFAKIELTEDGTCVVTLYGKTNTGTWVLNQEDSDKIDITVNGITASVICDGKTIEITNEGATLILKK